MQTLHACFLHFSTARFLGFSDVQLVVNILLINYLSMGPSEQPDFDFDLKFLGGDVGALPGVEKMIDVSSPSMRD